MFLKVVKALTVSNNDRVPSTHTTSECLSYKKDIVSVKTIPSSLRKIKEIKRN